MNRRQFLGGALAGTALAAIGLPAMAPAGDLFLTVDIATYPGEWSATCLMRWKDGVAMVLDYGFYDVPADAVLALGGGDHAAGMAALNRLMLAASTRKSL